MNTLKDIDPRYVTVLSPREFALTEEGIKYARNLRLEGYTCAEIGDRLKLPPGTDYDFMSQYFRNGYKRCSNKSFQGLRQATR